MIDEQTLKSIIDTEIDNSIGYSGGELENQRVLAMDYYLGEPLGNEVEGRSQVVSTDVQEVIEWIKPQLLSILHNGDRGVRFDPVSAEDEDQCIVETDAVNHEIYSENNGFLCDYSLVTDGLLQKTGVEKIFWEVEKEVEKTTYENLSEDEFLMLTADDDVEVVEHTERTEAVMVDGFLMEVTAHDVTIQTTTERGYVRIMPVPTEELLVSKRAGSVDIQESPFVAHRVEKSIADWVDDGYDYDVLKELQGETDESGDGTEDARNHLTDEDDATENSQDKSQRVLTGYECYARIDMDENGTDSLWKVVKIGNKIMEKEEVSVMPFNTWTPIILPHKFHGLSIADLIMDLQEIKTVLWRNTLDNLYLQNNVRHAVSERVDLNDMLTSRPGGLVRVEGDVIGDAVQPLITPSMAGDAMGMINYIDNVRQQRSGVSEMSQGLNQDIISDTAHAVERLMTAAEQKVALIARVFAETALKNRFKMVHALLREFGSLKHIKLAEQWKQVDPQAWPKRSRMTVSIGLGTGERDKLVGFMMGMLQQQKEIFMSGGKDVLVSAKNIHNMLSDVMRFAGIRTGSQYFTDPESPQAQQALMMAEQAQQEPDPNTEFVQAQMQIEQMKAELDKYQADMNAQFKMRELQLKERELDLKEQESLLDFEIDKAKILTESEKQANALQEAQIKAETDLAKEAIKQTPDYPEFPY